jgi:hypothetical protein
LRSYFFFLLLIIPFATTAQNEQLGLTVGIEIRSLQNFGILNIDSVVLSDQAQNFRAVYGYEGGFGFGGVVRARLTNFWNLETGIYFTRRRYSFRITDPSNGFTDETSFRVVGYEIPLKGLVYIRLGERLYSNVALGVSADFIASDIESVQPIYNIRAFKDAFLRAAVLGSLGFEYRTDEDGFFYLGASFHQPFGPIMLTQVNYFRNGDPPAYFQNGELEGSYFSIDFRYFFPLETAKQRKVRYVKPDWKNM